MQFEFEPLAPAEQIKLDLFPARVLTSGEDPELLFRESRIIVTDAHYYIFLEGGEGPVVAQSGTYTEFAGQNSTGWTLTDPDITIFRDAGCACGTSLRGIHPFAGVPHARYIPKGYEARFSND